MKNTFKPLLVGCMVLVFVFSTATAFFENERVQEQMEGTWTKAEDGAITDELQELFDKAMDGLEGVSYTPVELLETQVVSGMNYKFLCDSQVTVPNAEVKQAVVTIYESLDGKVEILDITDMNVKDIKGAQMPNPFIEAESLEEAEKGAGFTMEIPDSVEGYEGRRISYIEKDLIQIVYGDEETNLYVRKSSRNEDIAGDYSEYQKMENIYISGKTVNQRSNEEGIYTVTWFDGGFSYSITSSKAMSGGLVENLVVAIK